MNGFAEPFGMAWLGYLMYIVVAIIALWAIIWLAPILIFVWRFIVPIFMFPINLLVGLLGKGKKVAMNANIRSREK